jgi:preprotein translocase subunit SecA
VIVYGRRRKLLLGDEAEVEAILAELVSHNPDSSDLIATKKAELGEGVFLDLFRRLFLQMIDTLWVEHLEVMNYTRSSVNLRAYGQRDPLIEYRKEGVRLFREMQYAVFARVAEVLPRLQPVIVEAEEASLKAESKAAQAAAGGGSKKSRSSVPHTSTPTPGRNDLVTITNGTETQTVKYKKAETMLSSGWTIVRS